MMNILKEKKLKEKQALFNKFIEKNEKNFSIDEEQFNLIKNKIESMDENISLLRSYLIKIKLKDEYINKFSVGKIIEFIYKYNLTSKKIVAEFIFNEPACRYLIQTAIKKEIEPSYGPDSIKNFNIIFNFYNYKANESEKKEIESAIINSIKERERDIINQLDSHYSMSKSLSGIYKLFDSPCEYIRIIESAETGWQKIAEEYYKDEDGKLNSLNIIHPLDENNNILWENKL